MKFVGKKEAIKIMYDAIATINKMSDQSIFVLSIDLDNQKISDRGEYIKVEKGEKIINESATRVYSGNRYMSQIDLYSVFQSDMYNIKPVGGMKTILLSGIPNSCNNQTKNQNVSS